MSAPWAPLAHPPAAPPPPDLSNLGPSAAFQLLAEQMTEGFESGVWGYGPNGLRSTRYAEPLPRELAEAGS